MINIFKAKSDLQKELGCLVSVEGNELVVRGKKTDLTEYQGFKIVNKSVAVPALSPVPENKHYWFDHLWALARPTKVYFSVDTEPIGESEARIYIAEKGFKKEYLDFAVLIKSNNKRFMCRSDLIDAHTR